MKTWELIKYIQENKDIPENIWIGTDEDGEEYVLAYKDNHCMFCKSIVGYAVDMSKNFSDLFKVKNWKTYDDYCKRLKETTNE